MLNDVKIFHLPNVRFRIEKNIKIKRGGLTWKLQPVAQ